MIAIVSICAIIVLLTDLYIYRQALKQKQRLDALENHTNRFMNYVVDYVEGTKLEDGYGERKHKPATLRS